jgi:hypothetical protein
MSLKARTLSITDMSKNKSIFHSKLIAIKEYDEDEKQKQDEEFAKVKGREIQ